MLPITYYTLPATYFSLPIAYYPSPATITFCLLLITHYLLPISYHISLHLVATFPGGVAEFAPVALSVAAYTLGKHVTRSIATPVTMATTMTISMSMSSEYILFVPSLLLLLWR